MNANYAFRKNGMNESSGTNRFVDVNLKCFKIKILNLDPKKFSKKFDYDF